MSTGKQRIIKKYPNRRLYDTAVSRYITLDDIRKLVVAGADFRVVDAKSGDDISRNILLQIIVEQEEKGEPIFSTELLSQVIRFYGDALQTFMGTYLERSVESFAQQQRAVQEQMASFLKTAPTDLLTEMVERNLALWRNMQSDLLNMYRTGGSLRPTSLSKDDEGGST
jgi:polyhydroxyalkanoate synthesis repressor PhaR